MKKFNEWLSERDPDMYEESWLKKAALGAAFLAGTAGVGAGLGVAGPYIGQARASVEDRVGDLMGVKDAGGATRAREATRKQLSNKVGGNAALGAQVVDSNQRRISPVLTDDETEGRTGG